MDQISGKWKMRILFMVGAHGTLRYGELRRLLFCGTGALLSPLSTQQGESIPAVCHAVVLERS